MNAEDLLEPGSGWFYRDHRFQPELGHPDRCNWCGRVPESTMHLDDGEEAGLPPGCPLHPRSRARRALDGAVIVALWGLDLAVFVLGITWGYGLARAARAVIGGQP